MNKIITLPEVEKVCKHLRDQGKSIVLVGGCFDIFHYGHFKFLQEAKKFGAILLILLESDEKVRKLKGSHRPVTLQLQRAEVLSAFPFIDFVVLLNAVISNQVYYDIVHQIRPSSIALTKGDPQLKNKTRQAESVGAKVVEIAPVKTASTSEIIKLLSHDL